MTEVSAEDLAALEELRRDFPAWWFRCNAGRPAWEATWEATRDTSCRLRAFALVLRAKSADELRTALEEAAGQDARQAMRELVGQLRQRGPSTPPWWDGDLEFLGEPGQLVTGGGQ